MSNNSLPVHLSKLRMINGKQYVLITNFDKKDLMLHYLCCYLVKLPARIEEKAVDVLGNEIKDTYGLYVPENTAKNKISEYWDCFDYVLPIYRKVEKENDTSQIK